MAIQTTLDHPTTTAPVGLPPVGLPVVSIVQRTAADETAEREPGPIAPTVQPLEPVTGHEAATLDEPVRHGHPSDLPVASLRETLSPALPTQAAWDSAAGPTTIAPTAGAPRRLGLGPPLRHRPDMAPSPHPRSASVQRTPPLPLPPASMVQRAQPPTAAEPEPAGPAGNPVHDLADTPPVALLEPAPPAALPLAPLLADRPLVTSLPTAGDRAGGEHHGTAVSEAGDSVRVQRSPASLQPPRAGAAATLAPRALVGPSDPVAAALSTGLAVMDSDGAVVFPGLAAPGTAPSTAPGTAPPVQRVAEAEPAASEPMPATSTAPPADTAAGGGTPKAGAVPINPAELDELAKRLYDRIRNRLKAELRLDRERAGLATR
jgi:hypothetical protein